MLCGSLDKNAECKAEDRGLDCDVPEEGNVTIGAILYSFEFII